MRRSVNLMTGKRAGKRLIWTPEHERCEKADGISRPRVNELYERYILPISKKWWESRGVGNRDEKPVRSREMEKKWPRARLRNGPRWSLLWRGHIRARLSRKNGAMLVKKKKKIIENEVTVVCGGSPRKGDGKVDLSHVPMWPWDFFK